MSIFDMFCYSSITFSNAVAQKWKIKGGGEQLYANKSPKSVVRKSDPDYNKYGFKVAGIDDLPKSQCVECGEFLPQPFFFLQKFG